MLIKSAKFIKSYASSSTYTKELDQENGLPEICVVGRSNVGKSSFINTVSGNSSLARTSSTPGRTRLINLFDINNGEFTLVDLPGYGFAKASKGERDAWDRLIGGYFENSVNLKHVFVLVDIRIPPTTLDKQMLGYLYHFGIPFSVIATKTDKLSKAQASRARQVVATELKIGKDNIILFSSQTRQGKEEVLDRFSQILYPET
ncbi:MAG: YihA family ribosome biogenesis GTP-binding protein [Clostridiales bacterium]|nr:YihA family ribosome biogenesis GTP-binding protein [Clostridiales bacterium]